MRWTPRRRSRHLEDRRGSSGGAGFGGLPIPIGGKGGGIVGALVLVAILLLGRGCLTGGGDSASGGFDVGGLTDILEEFAPADGAGTGENPLDPADDPDANTVDFMSFVLDDVQGFWDGHFADAGQEYPYAELVLFRDGVQSGCGFASSATGPFYCPADSKAYLDVAFFRELSDRFGAPGDFAQAYVLAHELGHHVQNVLGINEEVRRLQAEDPDRANELSVRLELQADCFAGVWAHSAFQRDLLSDGDLQEGLGAAESVGDDRLGANSPESFTHGSSEQRQRWFRVGYDSGSVDACDTFSLAEGDL
jgi:predicted metalloprotease